MLLSLLHVLWVWSTTALLYIARLVSYRTLVVYTCLGVDHTPLSPGDRDVFDKLFEEAPEKLEAVKRVSDVHLDLTSPDV